jgi:hypothetical protein
LARCLHRNDEELDLGLGQSDILGRAAQLVDGVGLERDAVPAHAPTSEERYRAGACAAGSALSAAVVALLAEDRFEAKA